MNLNLFTIAGLFITGIGAFLLSFSLPELVQRLQGYYGSIMEDGLALFVLTGFGFIGAGIMMLMRLKKSTTFATFILVASMIGWIIFFLTVIYPSVSGDEKALIYLVGIFVLIFLFLMTLFVNNNKVIASIDDRIIEEGASDDILDKL